MRRHSPLVYVLSALELLAAGILLVGSFAIGQGISREPRPARLDDWLGLAAMATTGAASAVAGAAGFGHSRLTYAVLRRAHLAAASSQVLMMGAGVGIWAFARHRGGDWVGLGMLIGVVILGAGGLLLALSLVGLKALRKTQGTR